MKNNLTERRPTKLDREDITEPKRAENAAELRQLVDVIPQQVYVFGPDWTPLFANQRERDYLGLSARSWSPALSSWRHESRGRTGTIAGS